MLFLDYCIGYGAYARSRCPLLHDCRRRGILAGDVGDGDFVTEHCVRVKDGTELVEGGSRRDAS